MKMDTSALPGSAGQSQHRLTRAACAQRNRRAWNAEPSQNLAWFRPGAWQAHSRRAGGALQAPWRRGSGAQRAWSTGSVVRTEIEPSMFEPLSRIRHHNTCLLDDSFNPRPSKILQFQQLTLPYKNFQDSSIFISTSTTNPYKCLILPRQYIHHNKALML